MSSLSKQSLIIIGAVAAVGAAGVAAVTFWYCSRRKKSRASRPEDFTMPVAIVEQLWLYPLKSAHRLEVNEIECLARGFRNDRCWVVTDKDGRIVYQSKAPVLATVLPLVEENGKNPTLVLNAPGMEAITIDPPSADNPAPVSSVQLFNMTGEAYDVGDAAADWISRLTEIEGCRIKYMSPDQKPRKLVDHHKYSDICQPKDETSFAQFAPVFIASQSSLNKLNAKLAQPVPMTRFRPNIIISGCPPHEEDCWSEIKIGDSCILRGITPGQRCVVTTVDQELGVKSSDGEPLKTLRKYRSYEQVYGVENSRYAGGGPLFGADYGIIAPGSIKVGDRVYIKQ